MNKMFVAAVLAIALLISFAWYSFVGESVSFSVAAGLSFAGLFAIACHRRCRECPHGVLKIWAIQSVVDIAGFATAALLAAVGTDIRIDWVLLIAWLVFHTYVLITSTRIVAKHRDSVNTFCICCIYGSHAFAMIVFINDT